MPEEYIRVFWARLRITSRAKNGCYQFDNIVNILIVRITTRSNDFSIKLKIREHPTVVADRLIWDVING